MSNLYVFLKSSLILMMMMMMRIMMMMMMMMMVELVAEPQKKYNIYKGIFPSFRTTRILQKSQNSQACLLVFVGGCLLQFFGDGGAFRTSKAW